MNVSKRADDGFDRKAFMKLLRVTSCYELFEKIPARRGWTPGFPRSAFLAQ